MLHSAICPRSSTFGFPIAVGPLYRHHLRVSDLLCLDQHRLILGFPMALDLRKFCQGLSRTPWVHFCMTRGKMMLRCDMSRSCPQIVYRRYRLLTCDLLCLKHRVTLGFPIAVGLFYRRHLPLTCDLLCLDRHRVTLGFPIAVGLFYRHLLVNDLLCLVRHRVTLGCPVAVGLVEFL